MAASAPARPGSQPRPGPHPVEAALPAAGLLYLAVSVVLLSSAWPLTKIALIAGASPLWFAVGRAVLSMLVMTGVASALGRWRLPGRADMPALVGIGAFQLAAYFLFAHEAVAWVPAGRTAILANTTTVWIVPLSLLLLGEAIPPRRWLAAALGLAGVTVLVGPWSIDWRQTDVVVGHAFLLGASLSWALAIVAVRRFRPRSPLTALLPWCFMLAVVLLLPAALALAPAPTLGDGRAGWLALAYVGLLAGPIGTWCVIEATTRLPALVSSVGFLATPAVGLVLSSLLLGEAITADLLAGAALILSGIACTAWPARRRA